MLDQRRGSKLEPRWEGPYVLSDLAWHRKSGRLLDFNTGEVVQVKKGALHDRVHLNDLKVYLRRDIAAEAGMTMVDILEYEERVMRDLGELEDVFSLERTGVGITLAGIACIIMRKVYATMGESIYPIPSSLSRDFPEASRRLLRT